MPVMGCRVLVFAPSVVGYIVLFCYSEWNSTNNSLEPLLNVFDKGTSQLVLVSWISKSYTKNGMSHPVAAISPCHGVA